MKGPQAHHLEHAEGRQVAAPLQPRGFQYPRGLARPDDEGEFKMRLGHNGVAVLVDFQKPVTWIGLGPDEAEQFAAGLVKHAAELRRLMKKRIPA